VTRDYHHDCGIIKTTMKEECMNERRSQTFCLFATVFAFVTLLATPATVSAQEATPAGLTESIQSLTREELEAQIVEDLGFTEAATTGGTFLDSSIGDIQSLHPLLVDEFTSVKIVNLLFESLIGNDVRNGQPAPTGLADSWEIAPDGATYTFHLDTDATWHDGVDVTAEDVQFSFDAMADPDLGSAYTGAFLDATKSWRVIDDDTFEVIAHEPLATFLFDLVPVFIIPKHIWESIPSTDWRTDPGATGIDPLRVIGSGPFKFQEWRQGESVTVVRNDEYHGKVPYIDAYVLRIWSDQTALVNALITGEIDAAGLEPTDVQTVAGTAGLQVATFSTPDFTLYLTNLDPQKTTLFLDQRVRQALLSALDRESMVRDILLGQGEVAQGTQPVISYAYAPDQLTTTYAFDPAHAQALLSEAGWSDTNGDGIVDKGDQPFSFELIYRSGSPTNDQLVAYMQDAWRDVGVEVIPRALEFPALVETISGDHEFDVALISFSWDASFTQDSMFACDQYTGGFNVVKYCNADVDELFDEAKRTLDLETRRRLLIQATNLINDDLPVAVMFFGARSVGYSDRLQNYKPTAWGTDPRYIWIQR
jgi:peptide/nickel transport system substrate-binding protein